MNNFTCIANLCRDPETIELGGKECYKLRLADNTFGKQSVTRFFDAIVGGPDAGVASKLKQGDQILVTGTLQATQYKAKQGKNKGQMVNSDQMPFAKILQVTKSPSFFAGAGGDADDGDATPDVPDADPTNGATGEADPLADLY